jgi:hypothetical protein
MTEMFLDWAFLCGLFAEDSAEVLHLTVTSTPTLTQALLSSTVLPINGLFPCFREHKTKNDKNPQKRTDDNTENVPPVKPAVHGGLRR